MEFGIRISITPPLIGIYFLSELAELEQNVPIAMLT